MTATSPARPAASKPSPSAEEIANRKIAQVIRRHGAQPDALIEVLHQVQEIHGYLPKQALDQVARQLRMPLSRVYGVASFYHLFTLEPPTPHRCAVCLGTACFVKGGADVAARLEQRLGVKLDDAAGNGTWAVQHVSCLGACGQAPVLVVDGVLLTKLPIDQPEALDAVFESAGMPSAGAVPA
ncbi:NAD(P)H-dependent oxidoreductase subunit E [Synechococcus sp. 1G10]|uniref:NADH-quinone oxidoreductase subunit NuoE family protein n=1 Tax=Synechococcus sp. 1G10 TaxID=2025605 RepID=UPI000B993825|nr:NAD(P)H-dependent oxidoreductase subunit E [Synechococcus sp. 1G10]